MRYATVLETDIKDTIPTIEDPATLGLVDVQSREFIPLVSTRAWNFQQGCMAHWLGTNPDSLIIYNDQENGHFVSIILNVFAKERIKVIPYPVSAVSPDGGMEYFNHTLFSRDGSKIFWLARATPVRNTVSMCVNTDGSDLLACFPEGWGGSHFDWPNGDELMVTAAYEGKTFGHILFTPGERDYKRLGKGILYLRKVISINL